MFVAIILCHNNDVHLIFDFNPKLLGQLVSDNQFFKLFMVKSPSLEDFFN